MDGMILLAEARASGLTVRAAGDRLVIRGPKRANAVARRLLESKAIVLAALVSPQPTSPISRDHLPPDWREAYEERAAIMQYDGGLTRKDADSLALADTLARMRDHGA